MQAPQQPKDAFQLCTTEHLRSKPKVIQHFIVLLFPPRKLYLCQQIKNTAAIYFVSALLLKSTKERFFVLYLRTLTLVHHFCIKAFNMNYFEVLYHPQDKLPHTKLHTHADTHTDPHKQIHTSPYTNTERTHKETH